MCLLSDKLDVCNYNVDYILRYDPAGDVLALSADADNNYRVICTDVTHKDFSDIPRIFDFAESFMNIKALAKHARSVSAGLTKMEDMWQSPNS